MFPARSTGCDWITSLEHLCSCDCMMDFCLKDDEKAILANSFAQLFEVLGLLWRHDIRILCWCYVNAASGHSESVDYIIEILSSIRRFWEFMVFSRCTYSLMHEFENFAEFLEVLGLLWRHKNSIILLVPCKCREQWSLRQCRLHNGNRSDVFGNSWSHSLISTNLRIQSIDHRHLVWASLLSKIVSREFYFVRLSWHCFVSW